MMENIPVTMLGHNEKLLVYANMQTSFINMEAIFSDETENFVTKRVKGAKTIHTIRIRTKRDNVDEAYIHCNEQKIELAKKDPDELFDYYSADMDFKDCNRKYYFSLEKNGRVYYYNKRGLYPDIDHNYDFMMTPKFVTPEWAKGALMYQIFVDRFCNGDKSNDVVNNEYAYLGKAAKKVENWHQELSTDDICNFYGGDLKGIMDKMPYLKSLGVEVIFLNPIFVSPSNHKYDIQDYDYIDPHYSVITEDGGEPLYFGRFRNRYASKYMKRTTDKKNLEQSNKFFEKFVKTAHDNGIKIILDGVFNHCGAFNKWLDKEGFYQNLDYPPGAYRDKNSPYHDYFKWYINEWPNNDGYDSWWGHDNHPKLNFEASKELYEYFMDIGRKWVSPPYNVDGWRLDVAADLGYSPEFNHKFWADFRKSVKAANPDAIILGEHYGSPESWLQGDQWDTIMNYDAFMEPLTWFLTGMEKHSEEFRGDMLCNAMAFEGALRFHMSKYPIEALQISMNELSNHDHSRFLTRTNMRSGRLHTKGKEAADSNLNKAIMYEAVTFQMTWPGAPTIYYGDEAGMTGWTDPDNRRTYPWGHEDQKMLSFHRDIAKLRGSLSCLAKGSLEFLTTDYGIFVYARWNEKEKIIVVLNNNQDEKEITIPVWRAHVATDAKIEQLLETAQDGYSMEKKLFTASLGKLTITAKPYSSLILREAAKA